jgi:hypothetical protein
VQLHVSGSFLSGCSEFEISLLSQPIKRNKAKKNNTVFMNTKV